MRSTRRPRGKCVATQSSSAESLPRYRRRGLGPSRCGRLAAAARAAPVVRPTIRTMARALAIVQARMSSSRLPGKSVADVHGEPMLMLLLRRLQRAQEVERIIVATSTESADDRVDEVAREVVTDVHRGPLD